MSKTTNHNKISEKMHYTVMLALIISLITSFLLGMLLTETLWGGGLGYFSDYARQNTIERRREAFYNSIRSQVHAQQVQARAPGAPILDPDPGDSWEECWQNCHEFCGLYPSERDQGICRTDCVTECNYEHPKDIQVDGETEEPLSSFFDSKL